MGEVMSRFVFISITFILFSLSLLGCGRNVLTDVNTGTINTASNKASDGGIKGYVILKDQTNHSGTLVELSGTNISTVTDTFGFYEISGVSPSNVTINYSSPGYCNTSTRNIITSGVMNNITNIYLTPATNNIEITNNIQLTFGSITGTAKFNGTPTFGITVSIKGTPYSTKTAPDGSYSFSNLPSQNYTLLFDYLGLGNLSQEVPVLAGANTNAITVDLITGTGVISGKVILEEESDYSNTKISLDGTLYSGLTDIDGSFTISYIPTGTYDLTITKPGFITENISQIYITGTQPAIISDITLPVYYYDMSSVLTGMIYSMAYLNGQLYINADKKLYIVPTTEPTSPTINPIITTGNFYSISKYYDPGQDTWVLTGFSDEDDDGLCEHKYTIEANISKWLGDSISPIYADALCFSPESSSNFFLFDTLSSNYIETDEDSSVKTIYLVTQNSIVSLDYLDEKFFSCNSNTIYKYDRNFCITNSFTLDTSSLVDVAYDGSFIWAIDSNRRLYRIRDS